MRVRLLRLFLCSTLGLILYSAGCAAPVKGQSAEPPSFSHVFVIVEENEEDSTVLPNGARYVNQLAPQFTLLAQYYAVRHPSLPNYLALIAGDTFGITSDCLDCFVNQPSLPDQLEANNRRWRAYAEDMPTPCFVGDSGQYAQRHNPFIYFDSVRTQADRCSSGVVPFSQFSTDLSQHQLPDYAFIIPNVCNDGHDCSWQVSDQWLQQVVPMIQGSSEYQDGGAIFIVWDEGSTNAGCCNGLANGGHVIFEIVSPLVKPGYVSAVPATHYSLLRTIEDAWGLPPLAHAADVTPITDVWNPAN